MSENGPSFLALLLQKKADVLRIGEQTGKNVNSASLEVDRQIKQANMGDPITGVGVTKSGPET